MVNSQSISENAIDDLGQYFLDQEIFVCRNYATAAFCKDAVERLKGNYKQLPTDGGNVYELFQGEISDELTEVAQNVARSIGRASKLPLDVEPSIHEVVRYNDRTSLTMHRDRDGNGLTKAILTLSGWAVLLLEDSQTVVSVGDLVVMRGRDILNVPTPLHGTRSNYNRKMLLIEPNYKKLE